MSRCRQCDQGERRPECGARMAESDGRAALVLGVLVEVCESCGRVWLIMEVAMRLDELFESLLSSGAETAQTHWESAAA